MNKREEASKNETKPVILIVDDQTANLKILSSVLSRTYSLSLANSGINALKYLETNMPDLILLDVMMPEMDGYEVCKKIKEAEHLKDIPVVFLTAKTDIDDVVKGFDLGAVDYISKPFNITELQVRVRNHLKMRQTYNQLQNANVELQKLNQEKDRFFSIIAHDLRGPLSGFSGLTGLLLAQIRKKDMAMVERYAEAMLQSSTVTLELLQNLMDWARSQTGHLVFNPAPLDLKEIFDDSIKLLTNESERKSLVVKNTIDESMRPIADKDMMGVVIRNLLSNAVKFSNTGGEVTIAAENKDNELVLSVTDNGIGMSETMVNDLFRLNKNVRRPGTAKEPSSGLGLLLCKELLTQQGGNIWVRSQENNGTTVFVSLPTRV